MYSHNRHKKITPSVFDYTEGVAESPVMDYLSYDIYLFYH